MKGHTNNPNGRPRGVPNKVTTDLRQCITNFLEDNWEQIQRDWQDLEPKDRIVLFEKLLKYVLPTLQSIQNENCNNNAPVEIRVIRVKGGDISEPQ
jgi:hypothetical protein